jgi:carboxyl-terminal processing protease
MKARIAVLSCVLAVSGLPYCAHAGNQPDEEALVVFTRTLAAVREEYVDEVDAGRLIRGAIQEMLTSLDPHSDYLDSEMHERLKQEHSGSFFGVGMTISMRGRHLTVISPIDGTPAALAGIRAGDRIVAIDGEPTEGMTTSEAAHLIRGPKGTTVTLGIARDNDSLVDYRLTRDRIPIYSIPYAFMIRPDIAYIRMSSFGRTTADELDSALARLETGGMGGLILDLRWNSGGLYDAAVEVADRFLTEGKVIVTTRGRTPSSHRTSIAGGDHTWPDLPLVLLVNQGSASASEIVAGAVQDHHRGVVAGAPTFGKGLVQSLFKLSDGGALKLTTARYYTPSGRCIQRSYKGQREEEYERRGLGQWETDGGIHPDVELAMERRVPSVVDAARRDGLLFEFAQVYLQQHPLGTDAAAAKDSFVASYNLPPDFVWDLEQFLGSRDVHHDRADYETAGNDLAVYVKAEIAGLVWNQESRYRVLAELDDQLAGALDLLTRARAMLAQGPS